MMDLRVGLSTCLITVATCDALASFCVVDMMFYYIYFYCCFLIIFHVVKIISYGFILEQRVPMLVI